MDDAKAVDMPCEIQEARLLEMLHADCYAATSSLLAAPNHSSPLYQPYADQQRIREGQPKPVWPNGAAFAVCLTHDVDAISLWNGRMHFRRLAKQSRALMHGFHSRAWRGFQSSVFKLGTSVRHAFADDPIHCFERWLHMEAAVAAKSTFLFLPDRYKRSHFTDGGYRYDDTIRFDKQPCTVAEMMREIHRRGWEVGLHASWQCYDDPDELKRQKEQVELAIDSEVQSVRHHHLHFDIRRTPRALQKAGIKVDSSIGFNDNIGFRYGTSYPAPLRDLARNEPLDVWEIPLAIQDRPLVEALGQGSQELALRWAEVIAARVKSVGGVLTLLWHPECIHLDCWSNVYRKLLKILRDEGAWFGTMAQIIGQWREQRARQSGCVADPAFPVPDRFRAAG